jgi:ArsR family transcriptional regulator
MSPPMYSLMRIYLARYGSGAIFVNTNMNIPKDSRLASMDAAFKALADPTRLRILGLLRGGEVCVCDIHGSLGIPQPKASRHLSYLKKSGLVTARKQGLWVHYQIAPLGDAVMKSLMGAVTHCLCHVELVSRDRQRLETKTGCCAPAESQHPSFDCCRPPRQSSSERRRAPQDRRKMPRAAR